MRLTVQQRENILGYAFIAPWLIGLVVFSLVPIVTVMFMSFTDADALFTRVNWIGIENYYRALYRDRLFWRSLNNTLYYVSLAVPGQMVFGLALAMLLNTKIKGVSLYRSMYYIPSIVPAVATSILWVWIFSPHGGLLNYALSAVGLPELNWLASRVWSKPALIIMSLWGVGGSMIIYLAGLQSIPEHLYEAATIDGASAIRKFIAVTIPMMTPTIFYNLVIGIINSFQVFQSAYIMTGGGPLNSTLFYVLYLYRNAFQFFRMGYASALAWILFVIVLVFTLIVFRSSRSWVYYEAKTD